MTDWNEKCHSAMNRFHELLRSGASEKFDETVFGMYVQQAVDDAEERHRQYSIDFSELTPRTSINRKRMEVCAPDQTPIYFRNILNVAARLADLEHSYYELQSLFTDEEISNARARKWRNFLMKSKDALERKIAADKRKHLKVVDDET